MDSVIGSRRKSVPLPDRMGQRGTADGREGRPRTPKRPACFDAISASDRNPCLRPSPGGCDSRSILAMTWAGALPKSGEVAGTPRPGQGDVPKLTRSRNLDSLAVGLLVDGALCAGVFLLLTLPRVHWGPVIGTGQDDWYNAVRSLRPLYDRFNPSYFIHPALFYELLAGVYGIQSAWLSVTGTLTGGFTYLDYFLVNELQFLDVARCASMSYGMLAVAASVWLGGLLSGRTGALLAGLIVASLPLLQALAISIRVDALALATLIGATALVVRCHHEPSRRSLLVAAAAIGIATAANY